MTIPELLELMGRIPRPAYGAVTVALDDMSVWTDEILMAMHVLRDAGGSRGVQWQADRMTILAKWEGKLR
jgi:hypothetical protein|tara:strand:- start:272 stop:481 length:210 start_codon:yes stop_codon:yes gene_type:complete